MQADVAITKVSSYYKTYGVLNNWPAAMNGANSSSSNPSGVQGVGPSGWHLPSDAEWKKLEMFLSMVPMEADTTRYRGYNEGGKLKEEGTSHWDSPNTGANNSSGFTAIPGDCCDDSGFHYNGGYSYFWSATKSINGMAWYRKLSYLNKETFCEWFNKEYGFSIRSIRN